MKRVCVIIAYAAYTSVTICRNTLNISLPPTVDYVMIGIVGVSLKLADSTQQIENIIQGIDTKTMDSMMTKLNNIETMSQQSITQRTIQPVEVEHVGPHEVCHACGSVPSYPYGSDLTPPPTPNEDPESVREYKLPGGQIIRVKNK